MSPQPFLLAELIREGSLFFSAQAVLRLAELGGWGLVKVICDEQKLPLATVEELVAEESASIDPKERTFKPGSWFLFGDKQSIVYNLHQALFKIMTPDHKLMPYFQTKFFGFKYIVSSEQFYNDPKNFAMVSHRILVGDEKYQLELMATKHLQQSPIDPKLLEKRKRIAQAIIERIALICERQSFEHYASKLCFKNLWHPGATYSLRKKSKKKREDWLLDLIERGQIELTDETVGSFLTYGMRNAFKLVVPSKVKTITIAAKYIFPSRYRSMGQVDILKYAIQCGALPPIKSWPDFDTFLLNVSPIDFLRLVHYGLVDFDFEAVTKFAEMGRNQTLIHIVEFYYQSKKDQLLDFYARSKAGIPMWFIANTLLSAELDRWNAVRFGFDVLPQMNRAELETLLSKIWQSNKLDVLKYLVEVIGVDFSEAMNGEMMKSKKGLRPGWIDVPLYLFKKGDLLSLNDSLYALK